MKKIWDDNATQTQLSVAGKNLQSFLGLGEGNVTGKNVLDAFPSTHKGNKDQSYREDLHL